MERELYGDEVGEVSRYRGDIGMEEREVAYYDKVSGLWSVKTTLYPPVDESLQTDNQQPVEESVDNELNAESMETYYPELWKEVKNKIQE